MSKVIVSVCASVLSMTKNCLCNCCHRQADMKPTNIWKNLRTVRNNAIGEKVYTAEELKLLERRLKEDNETIIATPTGRKAVRYPAPHPSVHYVCALLPTLFNLLECRPPSR